MPLALCGERNAWPGGHNDDAAWRRSEGICWLEGGRPDSVNWKKDHANGASVAILPKPAEDGVEGAANQSK